MNKQSYDNIKAFVENYPNGTKVIELADKISTAAVYLTYLAFLIILTLKQDPRIWKVVFIPAITFVLVSVFRKFYNAPRPYEALDIKPIIYKDTKGNSFPSRHVFSTFIIAMTLYYISAPIGIALMLIGLIVSLVRVVGGVHFPKDVVAGALVGIVFGIIGWNLFS